MGYLAGALVVLAIWAPLAAWAYAHEVLRAGRMQYLSALLLTRFSGLFALGMLQLSADAPRNRPRASENVTFDRPLEDGPASARR